VHFNFAVARKNHFSQHFNFRNFHATFSLKQRLNLLSPFSLDCEIKIPRNAIFTKKNAKLITRTLSSRLYRGTFFSLLCWFKLSVG